jgi:thioredoxin reductase
LEVVNKFRSELEYLKFARRMDLVEQVERQAEGFKVHTKSGEQFDTRALIVATGVRQRRLSVPGEKDYIMRGLCYSALSYAPLFIDRKTVVVGEGDLALRSAAELATVASHVHLVGPDQEALSSVLGKKLQQAKNVSVMTGYTAAEVKGNGFANRIVVKSQDGQETEIEADGIFVELSLVPDSQMVAHLVALDEQGRIKVDCFARTSVPGIFAAGDVTNTYAEQVLVAVGDGAKAALSAYDYLLPML